MYFESMPFHASRGLAKLKFVQKLLTISLYSSCVTSGKMRNHNFAHMYVALILTYVIFRLFPTCYILMSTSSKLIFEVNDVRIYYLCLEVFINSSSSHTFKIMPECNFEFGEYYRANQFHGIFKIFSRKTTNYMGQWKLFIRDFLQFVIFCQILAESCQH